MGSSGSRARYRPVSGSRSRCSSRWWEAGRATELPGGAPDRAAESRQAETTEEGEPGAAGLGAPSQRLVRHGLAKATPHSAEDSAPLTAKGHRRSRKAPGGLSEIMRHFPDNVVRRVA